MIFTKKSGRGEENDEKYRNEIKDIKREKKRLRKPQQKKRNGTINSNYFWKKQPL